MLGNCCKELHCQLPTKTANPNVSFQGNEGRAAQREEPASKCPQTRYYKANGSSFFVPTDLEEHHRDHHPRNAPCLFSTFFMSSPFPLKRHHRPCSGIPGYILSTYVTALFHLYSFIDIREL